MTEDQMTALVDARTKQSKDSFSKHFQGIPDDLSLIVLKGHLLIERALTVIISHYARPSADVGKVGLRFPHKVALVRALVPSEFFLPGFWGFAKVLNQLRNDLAHELEPKELEKHLASVRSMVAEHRRAYGQESVPLSETDEGTLKQFISVWLGVLDPIDCLVHTIEKSKTSTVDLRRLGEILRDRCSRWSEDSTKA